jgi:cystathionine beta-lyase/cystathionine gamma-synthase
MDISYILNILGEERSDYFDAVTPPIVQTSNFAFKTVADFKAAIAQEKNAHLYTRGNNPTTEIVRKKIAALEGAEDCLIFSSGAAAISSVLLYTLKSGDHVVCVRSPYSWTHFLLTQIFTRFQVETTFVDGRDTSLIEAAVQPNTKLIYLESPNTFAFELQDLSAICRFAQSKQIFTAIDNSYSGGLYQQAHTMGVDFIIHTATKYLAGHSDVVAGAVCGKQAHMDVLFREIFMAFGAVLSPHDSWLLLRGLRTLPLRLQKSAENAERIIHHFEKHPDIQEIIYPYHPSHPQYELAKKQMVRGSGLFAMVLRTGDYLKTEAFCNRLQRFLLAVSWGGYESLVVPASIKENSELPAGYVRFYAGLEEADVLIADIEQALLCLHDQA